ncbi:MAG TPA: response regulator [Bryobacteraceae bacterium]|nr:response regulator [Bryobacteraceae bacterium]
MAVDASRETILLADDEPIVLDLARTILKRSGYRVLSAEDGPTALEMFHREPSVDLIVTDVMMPEMSGPQLVHKIHSINSDVRCLFMSGYSPDQIHEKGAGNLGCDYLRKPFTPDMLLAAVRRQLSAA